MLKLSREEIRYVYCSSCGARPGSPCVGRKGRERIANHQARVNLAYRILAPLRPALRP